MDFIFNVIWYMAMVIELVMWWAIMRMGRSLKFKSHQTIRSFDLSPVNEFVRTKLANLSKIITFSWKNTQLPSDLNCSLLIISLCDLECLLGGLLKK